MSDKHWRYRHITAKEHRENLIALLAVLAMFGCYLFFELFVWHP